MTDWPPRRTYVGVVLGYSVAILVGYNAKNLWSILGMCFILVGQHIEATRK